MRFSTVGPQPPAPSLPITISYMPHAKAFGNKCFKKNNLGYDSLDKDKFIDYHGYLSMKTNNKARCLPHITIKCIWYA